MNKKYPADFIEWMNSDNVIKTQTGYLEQSSQYAILFPTIKELYKYFVKEFAPVNYQKL
jgi:predicted nucleotidyltransferase